jgi:hypothetical protein
MAAKLRITVVRCAIDIRPLSALLRRLTAALAYMIQRCKPVQNAAELMAQEVAEWPVEHLERVGFVAMTAGDWPRGLGWDSRADQPAIGLRMGRSDEGSPPPPPPEANRRSKSSTGAPAQPSFGSMRNRTSTISLGRMITGTRSAARTCARPTHRRPAIAQPRTRLTPDALVSPLARARRPTPRQASGSVA